MITVILILAVALAVRCAYLLKYPWGPCRKCQRHPGANKGSNRKRWGMCKACGGTKQRQRFGARTVHRFWWSVAGRMPCTSAARSASRQRERKRGIPNYERYMADKRQRP